MPSTCRKYFCSLIWHQQLIRLSSISSRTSFDNSGHVYNVTRIINADHTFNVEKYKTYSPLFLSTTFAIAYGLSFASITATISHTVLYFRKLLMAQVKRSMSEQPDVHARLMSRYPQVPEWWYTVIFGMWLHPICFPINRMRFID